MIVLVLLLLAADKPARFEAKKLAVDGEIATVTPADFDGDGFPDLLVVHNKGKPRKPQRALSMFWSQKGAFATKPDLSFSVPDGACVYDVADVDERKGSEVLLAGHGGVSALSFRDRDNRVTTALTKDATLFVNADNNALPRVMMAQKISGQGTELLVPMPDALAIYRRGADGWFSAGKIDTAFAKVDLHREWRGDLPTPHLGAFGLDIDFPDVHVADSNGDGLLDLIFNDTDRVAIFQQAPGLNFAREPTFQREFAVTTDKEMDEGFTQTTTQVRDLDNDGVVDILVTKQVNQGITSGESTTYVFMGKPGGGYEAQATQTIKRDGIGGTVSQLIDLTGDGKPELLLPSVKMGILAIIRVLTSSTVKVNVETFPFQDRKFGKAIAERTLTFKVSLSGKSDLQAIDLSGDYNGDRLKDLVLGGTGSELEIYPGLGKDKLVAEDALETIKVNGKGRVVPVDLDRKGKDDIVMFYPFTREERGVINVLYNRGPW